MFDFSGMEFSVSSIFAAYASLSASLMLIRTVFNDIIPEPVRVYIESALRYLFNRITPLSQFTTIVIEENSGISTNEIYEAAEIYLRSKVSPATERFKVHKTRRQNNISLGIEKDIEVNDEFRDFELKWKFVVVEAQNNYSESKKFFELSLQKEHKQTVLEKYLPFVLDKSKEIKAGDKVVRLYTRDCPSYDDEEGSSEWGSINLEHPSTFDTLAMDPDMKKTVIKDLERFVRRKDYYKKVGKAWKRGYLLYGPPGTGKSSLVAAIANYLRFDIYDLELTNMYSNSELRRVLLSTTNRSIILIEDIDCSSQMKDRDADSYREDRSTSKLTLSGMLNFIDGLWSSCGDERIIIFTTNHKNKLDPALLRPGRMDLHIHMSYCTYNGFKVLASNYLDCQSHRLFAEIEDVMARVTVTPAEIAEELMKSEEVDVALEGLIRFLKQKEVDQLEIGKDDAEEKVKVEVKPNVNGNSSSTDSELEECKVVLNDKMQMSGWKLWRKLTRKNRRTRESDQRRNRSNVIANY